MALPLFAYLVLESESGKTQVVRLIEISLQDPKGLSLSLGRIDGSLFDSFTLSSLTLSDSKGVWLEAEDLQLSWSPGALLGRRLEIQSLSAASLSIARAPELPPSDTPEEPFGIPRLPLSLSLASLEVPRIDLGQALLGKAVALDLRGHFRAPENGDFSSALDINRIDGADGELQAQARLNPEDEHLTIDLKLTEAAGGLVAQLLEDPSLPALSVTLEGAGTLALWSGQLDATVEGQAAVTGAIDLKAAEGLSLTAKGDANIDALLDETLRPLIAPRLAYDFQADFDQDDNFLSLPRLSVESDSFALSGKANLALDSTSLDGKFTLQSRDPAALNDLLAPLGFKGGEATADIALVPDSLSVALQGRLADVAFPEGRTDAADIELQLDADPSAAALVAALEGRLDFQGFTSGIPEADSLLGSAPALTLNGRFAVEETKLEIDQATLSAAAFSGAVKGALDLETLAGDLDGSLDLPDLAPFGALGDLAVAGAGTLDFQANSPDFAEGLDLTLNGTLTDPKTPFAEADALLGKKVTFSTALSQQADGVTVTSLLLQAAHAELEAKGALSDAFSQVAADYDIKVADLSVLSASLGTTLSGRLGSNGRIEGELSAPVVTGKADLSAAAVDDVTISQLDLDYRLENLATAPQGHLTAKGQSSYGPISADGSFKYAEDRLLLDPLHIEARKASIDTEGPLEILLASGLIQGKLQGRSENLGNFADLAGSQLAGDLTFNAKLAAEAGKQNADIEAQTQNFGFDDLQVSSAQLSLRANDLFGGFDGTASLDATGLAYGDQALDKLKAKAQGDLAALDFDVSAQGNYLSPFDLSAAGQLQVEDAATAVTLSKFSGTALGRPLSLTETLIVTQGPTGTSLSGLDLTFGPGKLQGDFALDAEQVQGKLTFNNMPLDLAEIASDSLDLNGQLSGTVKISGAPAAPRGQVDLKVQDFEIEQDSDTPLPKLQAEAQMTLVAGRLNLNGEVSGFADRSLKLQAAIPASFSIAPFDFQAKEEAALSGALQFNGSADSLSQLFIDPQERLRGDVAVDLALSGSVAQPVLTGDISLASATYENLVTGTTLKQLEAKIVAKGNDLQIETLKARTNGSGRINGSGSLSIDAARKFPLDLKVDLGKARLIERDDATIAFDGSIGLKGDLAKLILSGKLETTTAELRVISDLPPSVVTIDVIEKNLPEADKPRRPSKSEAPIEIVLDIALSMPGRVFLRGKDIDTEWQGQFDITGTTDKPEINGTLNPVRGYVSLLSKRFELQQGSISLDGAAEIDPLLDLTAVHKKTDLTAIVRVKGRLSDPEITLTSSPTLPEDEVISRVLFDKSASSLTPAETVQLAAAIASLAGGGSGDSLLGPVRTSLGLDVLNVGSNESGHANVSAGKYVVDGVYFGVDQGTESDSTRAKVEVDLTPTIKLESSAGSEDSTIGLKWKWDY